MTKGTIRYKSRPLGFCFMNKSLLRWQPNDGSFVLWSETSVGAQEFEIKTLKKTSRKSLKMKMQRLKH